MSLVDLDPLGQLFAIGHLWLADGDVELALAFEPMDGRVDLSTAHASENDFSALAKCEAQGTIFPGKFGQGGNDGLTAENGLSEKRQIEMCCLRVRSFARRDSWSQGLSWLAHTLPPGEI
jgi:hypothetical protein